MLKSAHLRSQLEILEAIFQMSGAEKPASRAPAEVENGTAQALAARALPLSTQIQQDHHLGQNLIIIHRLLEILLYFRGSFAAL